MKMARYWWFDCWAARSQAGDPERWRRSSPPLISGLPGLCQGLEQIDRCGAPAGIFISHRLQRLLHHTFFPLSGSMGDCLPAPTCQAIFDSARTSLDDAFVPYIYYTTHIGRSNGWSMHVELDVEHPVMPREEGNRSCWGMSCRRFSRPTKTEWLGVFHVIPRQIIRSQRPFIFQPLLSANITFPSKQPSSTQTGWLLRGEHACIHQSAQLLRTPSITKAVTVPLQSEVSTTSKWQSKARYEGELGYTGRASCGNRRHRYLVQILSHSLN